jgi:large subunit ribosomal protein L9
MKVMLLKDVYNLGRAGDVKKVANGYARNFLIPQNMAVPATAGATANVERIQAAANKQRELINEEMSGLAAQIAGLELIFKAKVGESGKLFGSITPQMIADAITEKIGANVDRRWVESQPLREAGDHEVKVRLTFDLVPEVKVIIVSDVEEKEEETEGKRKRPRKPGEEAETVEETVIEEVIVEETGIEETIDIKILEEVVDEIEILTDDGNSTPAEESITEDDVTEA